MSETAPGTELPPADALPPGVDAFEILPAPEKKKIRESARRIVKAREIERIEAERAEKGKAPAPKASASNASAPAPEADRTRTDDQRAKDAAEFLTGCLYPLAALVAWFTPWKLDLAKVSDAQALDDGRAWVPLARRYAFVDGLITWASLPARLGRRIRAMASPRSKAPPPPKGDA
jgi:hypothetical protein